MNTPTRKSKTSSPRPTPKLNSETQLRDLAVIISERGVVFFRENQQDLSVEELKRFTDEVGRLSERPSENGLHVHPLYRDPGNVKMGNGGTDENM